jgi:hypothetical protein
MVVKQLSGIASGVLLMLATPVFTQCQEKPEIAVGLGASYLRVLSGWGIGGELNARITVPTSFQTAKPFLGLRARAARLDSPSVFGSEGLFAGIGIHFGVERKFLNGRLRTHVSVPLELVHAGWDNGLLICIMPNVPGANECEPDSDTAPAVGIGSGADVRLSEGVELSVAVTGQWAAFDLRHSNMIWSSFWGFTLGL